MKKTISMLTVMAVCMTFFLISPKAQAADDIYGAGKVATSSTALNVRSAPSSKANIQGTVAKNSYVTLLYESGNYWYVSYGPYKYGYCHKNYITTVSQNTARVKTTSGSLRVRASASLSADIKDYLATGTSVTVLGTSGKFSRILYNGNRTGYVHSDYLSKNSYTAVKLNVPSFKQTDSRWANVTIGSSGKTIGKIGCATTALAMTESYRTGTTIYPDAMMKKLSYTSGGAVYWPSNYTIITSSSGYLQKIYNILSSGKPVILGCKNSSGSQHYVVITGVRASSTLSASSFYINDPGSNSRTTLNQFLSAYPNFYKFMYA